MSNDLGTLAKLLRVNQLPESARERTAFEAFRLEGATEPFFRLEITNRRWDFTSPRSGKIQTSEFKI